jgi:predicted nucleic acid-binding Zn ribbon protein
MIRIDRVIPGVLAAVIREAPLCPEKIAFAWREAVGPAIARVSTVRRDEGGILHVSVEPAWATEIHRSSALILRRLERLLGPGVVTSIEPSRQESPRPRRRC